MRYFICTLLILLGVGLTEPTLLQHPFLIILISAITAVIIKIIKGKMVKK